MNHKESHWIAPDCNEIKRQKNDYLPRNSCESNIVFECCDDRLTCEVLTKCKNANRFSSDGEGDFL